MSNSVLKYLDILKRFNSKLDLNSILTNQIFKHKIHIYVKPLRSRPHF